MPVSMVTLECPCCGREMELILVGSAHYADEMELLPKPRRQRRSRKTHDREDQGDGGLADAAEEHARE
jgi:hypothetical protein